MTARRALGSLLALGLALTACTSASPTSSPTAATRSVSPSATPMPHAGTGLIGRSASRAMARLCPRRPLGGTRPPAEGSAPAIVATVEHRVERIRGLEFTHRVPVDAVTHAELVGGLRQAFDASYPAELLKRRSRAWAAIGAIPPGTQIRRQLEAFASSSVVGYYDEVSKYLVYLGADEPSPVALVTLAHELTHALDDQHFGLMRLDELAAACDDEGFQAALALAEGDATYIMVAYAQRYLSLEEQLGLGDQGGGDVSALAPFILQLQTWPYTAGLGFVQRLVNDGGERAVDAAFRHLPTTTEQIIDPSAYPDDAPVTVDIPQLAPALGDGWRDLDVQGAGAAWLSILLGLHIDQNRASAAVQGWEGGLYRAWADGRDVAVALRTRWQDQDAAARFASAMRDWIERADVAAEVRTNGVDVDALFASDAPTLAGLVSAAAGARP